MGNSKADPAEIAATVDEIMRRNRALYAGWQMMADDDDDDTIEDPGDKGDDDPDDDDEPDDDDDDKSDDDPDPAKELERTREALKKANAEAKKHRLALREAKKKAEEGGDDPDEKVAAAVKEAEAKWKPRVINSAARSALLEAGADKPERLLKLVDIEELDVDEKGEIDGLDDEVERLRDEYPELFKKKGRTRVETGDRSDSGPKKAKSATERQAAALVRS